MTLEDLILSIKKIVDKNPDALKMEVWGTSGSSGCGSEMGHPYIRKINEDSECGPWVESFGNDYSFDTYVDFYMGN